MSDCPAIELRTSNHRKRHRTAGSYPFVRSPGLCTHSTRCPPHKLCRTHALYLDAAPVIPQGLLASSTHHVPVTPLAQ